MTSVSATLPNTIGAAYAGVVTSAILFGITNLQTYLYFVQYPHDWPLQKLSVVYLWFLDALHLSITIQVVYHYLVSSFGNAAAQLEIVWTFKLQVAITVVIIVSVQTLYAIRVCRFGRYYHKLLPAIIVLVIAGGYGVGIVSAIETYKPHTFLEIHTIAWSIYLSLGVSTFIDFFLATVMCFYLQQSMTEFRGTKSKISTLIRYVLASGLGTSACSMTALITYALMPNTLVFLAVEFFWTKLYINSFLAMLNARRFIRSRNRTDDIGLSTSKLPSSYAVQISMHTHTETHSAPHHGIESGFREAYPTALGITTSEGDLKGQGLGPPSPASINPVERKGLDNPYLGRSLDDVAHAR